MFRLLNLFSPADGFGKDPSYYEWAEYNLPGATDMVVLQENNGRQAMAVDLAGDKDAVAAIL